MDNSQSRGVSSFMDKMQREGKASPENTSLQASPAPGAASAGIRTCNGWARPLSRAKCTTLIALLHGQRAPADAQSLLDGTKPKRECR